MCGVAGYISANLASEESRRIAEHLAKAIHHRGPDSHGVWTDGEAATLIHTRLAIVDLSEEGHQPMTSKDGRFVVSFNGEIYNHEEIREDLISRGISFRGHSDTEVLLESIAIDGLMETLKKATGMFAIALVDRSDGRLYLIRDRLGEKPLYYGYAQSDLVFGSELKVLIKYPKFPFEIDEYALSLFLKYGYVPAPECILKNAFKLMAAHIAEFDLKSGRRLRDPYPYWSLDELAQRERNYAVTESDGVDLIEGHLKKVISRQIRADVPVGCFLSGGVDSSLVSALAQSQLSKKLRTFTIGFEIDLYNEAPEAVRISDHLGTDHTEWIVQPKDALDLIPTLPEIYDEPFADSSQLPTTLLSRLTRKAVTVCLSGDGGDELFGGYNRYIWTKNIWRAMRFLPSPLARGVGGFLENLSPTWLARLNLFRLPNFPNKVAKVGSLLSARNQVELYDRLLSCWVYPSKVMPSAKSTSLVPSGPHSLGLIEYMMREDSKHYLTDDIMVKVDRASMSVALESRAPFLDHKLYELAWSLPVDFKVRGGQGKYLLRQILSKYVPQALWERPKTGFAVPLDYWFRGELKDWLSETLSDSQLRSHDFFNAQVIHQAITEHLSSTRNWQFQLWTVAMFQSWYDHWKKESNVSPI